MNIVLWLFTLCNVVLECISGIVVAILAIAAYKTIIGEAKVTEIQQEDDCKLVRSPTGISVVILILLLVLVMVDLDLLINSISEVAMVGVSVVLAIVLGAFIRSFTWVYYSLSVNYFVYKNLLFGVRRIRHDSITSIVVEKKKMRFSYTDTNGKKKSFSMYKSCLNLKDFVSSLNLRRSSVSIDEDTSTWEE